MRHLFCLFVVMIHVTFRRTMTTERSSDFTRGPVLGYGLFRWVLGLNFFMHGAVRIFGDYQGFVNWVGNTYQGTILAGGPAEMYAWVIPWIELVLGGLLMSGFLTRTALCGGMLFMGSLVFGMTLRQNWDTVAYQMIYCIALYLLLHHHRFNLLSIDYWFSGMSSDHREN